MDFVQCSRNVVCKLSRESQRDTREGGCYPFCSLFVMTKKNNKGKMQKWKNEGARDYPAEDCGKIRPLERKFSFFVMLSIFFIVNFDNCGALNLSVNACILIKYEKILISENCDAIKLEVESEKNFFFLLRIFIFFNLHQKVIRSERQRSKEEKVLWKQNRTVGGRFKIFINIIIQLPQLASDEKG